MPKLTVTFFLNRRTARLSRSFAMQFTTHAWTNNRATNIGHHSCTIWSSLSGSDVK